MVPRMPPTRAAAFLCHTCALQRCLLIDSCHEAGATTDPCRTARQEGRLAGELVNRRAVILSDEASPHATAQFERLYLEHAAAVRRHLVYLTGDPALADDLTQDTFGRLYQRELDSEDAPPDLRNPSAWLLTVASNLAYNHFRAESRRAARESKPGAIPGEGDIAPSPDVDDVLDVRQALAKLEPRDRTVLMLRHSGFSYAEIAEAVGLAPSSVGTILARAQARFRTVYVGASHGAEKE